MKTKFLLIVILFLSLKSISQNYIPMNLDTSCYWVHDYIMYNGGSPYLDCHAETVSFVEKDTTINNLNYHKIIIYTSQIGFLNTNNCFLYLPKGGATFIREDSINRKIFELQDFTTFLEKTVLDFNIGIGDTFISLKNTYHPIVDSVKIETINNVSRNVLYGSVFTNQIFKTIEGIGATHNFPGHGFGEWGIPSFTLKCYSKGGQILYGDTSQLCIKKPAVAVSTKDVFKNNFTLNYSNNSFRIDNPNNEKLKIILLDLMGNKIISETTNSIYYQSKISNSISTGIYILQVGNEKGKVVKKIVVE